MLAKRYATLDVLSQGRVIADLGIAWSKDEYQVSNIPFVNRGERADEFIQVLKRIWTGDVVEFKVNTMISQLQKLVPNMFLKILTVPGPNPA
jgi:alkanesulfonate monooxygenase SsuD/methylene tetrahydromethanopterin reductase-like flavin-dependent oxidoreductase (luciferase family)